MILPNMILPKMILPKKFVLAMHMAGVLLTVDRQPKMPIPEQICLVQDAGGMPGGWA